MDSTIIIYLSILLLIISNSITLWLYFRRERFFKSFTKNISDQDLKHLLHQLDKQLDSITTTSKAHQKSIDTLHQQSLSHLQKVGFVRFNPFSDTGGDQSFCLCLLDANNNGVTITSLHNREQTRIYAKLIQAGTSEHSFFDEEKQALDLALKSSSGK